MAESRTFPVLPLRDIVVYPKMAAPLFVGREKSVRALDEVMRKDKQILLAAQMDASEDEPSTDRIFTVGTVATVVQLLKLPDGTVRVLVEGAYRARITELQVQRRVSSKPRSSHLKRPTKIRQKRVPLRAP
jgi:ATP-dependent Lon protease